LSLAEAQHLALQNNADLRIAQTQVAAALAQLRATREFPNPVVGLSVAKINSDGRGNATAEGNRFFDRSYDSIASLSQLIELGKRGVRRSSAESGLRSAEAQRDDARRLLLQAVSQSYLAALAAQEDYRVLTQSSRSLRKEAEIAATRYHAGDIAASDQAQIEITADQLELSAGSAKAGARTAIVVLETLLGLPSSQGNTALTDTLAQLAGRSPGVEAPANPRPDVLAADAGLAKANSDLKLQKRGVLPDLTVSLQYERQPPDQPNTVGLGVSFPLPFWNRNTANILAARATRDQAQAQLDKVRVQASAEVTSARLAYEEARARARAYLQELQPKSAAIAKTVAYSYDKGGASLVELLAAERSDNDIRLATAHAQADAAAAAVVLAASLNCLEPMQSVQAAQP
jgi:cobalt-zinc-cadmium efflux system outer membrane protein